jgi:RNA polymerase sigma-70 factor, ECF subfamily
MNEIDDLTIQQAKKRNESAFKRLYDFYSPFVWKVAYRTMHGEMQPAKDAVQDTFIKIYKSLGKFENQCAFSTWLYRITFNTCMTLYAQKNGKKTFVPLDTESVEPEYTADTFHNKRRVSSILATLSAEERFLLTSREVLDFSYEELATISGKNEGQLRTQLFRIKETIRKTFGEKS